MRLAALVLLLSLCPLASFAGTISKQYGDVQAFMADLAKRYPQTVTLFDVGDSDSGQTIQGMKIGTGSLHNLVVATHHGNEYGSTEVAKGFAESVAANPIPGQTLYVIPVLNIGGYNARNREEKAGGLSYDPNRNYPGPCGTEGPFILKDITALANLVDKENIVTSATLHTFASLVMYPWGISASGDDLKTPYDDLFKQLAEASVQESGYETGNSTEMMYPADGTFEDYAFWKHGIWSLLWELGTSHTPSQSEVDRMVQANVPGLRAQMTTAPAQRAEKHDFTGKCDASKRHLDRHEE